MELNTIRREGKRIRSAHLELRITASLSSLPHSRVGIIVPKHGGSAVARNRLKRRLRELSRLILLPALSGVAADVVIRATPTAYGRDFPELAKEMEAASRRAVEIAAALPPHLHAGEEESRVERSEA